MDYKEFKEKVESLDIAWTVEPNYIWCPLYMTKKEGNVVKGNMNYTYKENEDILKEIFDVILEMNKDTKIEKDFVIVQGVKLHKYGN